MPDALALLKTRRSVKPMELNGPAPSAAEIDTPLTIAARVPDHGKLTPWRFIVFEGEARDAAGAIIADVFRADASGSHRRPDRLRAQAACARAAGDRGGQPRRPTCEDPGMGAAIVGRRRRHEPGDRGPRAWAMPRAGSPNGMPMTARVLDKLGLGAERAHRRLRAYRPPGQAAGGPRPSPARRDRHAVSRAKRTGRRSFVRRYQSRGFRCSTSPTNATMACATIRSRRSWRRARSAGSPPMDAAGQRQSRALLLLQRHRQPPRAGDVLLRRPQGLGQQHRRDRRVRLQPRHLGAARADERNLGGARARRQRDGARGA